MKVLMLGWEFPPLISGGLGTACYGLTKAMSALGTEIIFVLPRPIPSDYSGPVKLAGPSSFSETSDGEVSVDVDYLKLVDEQFANLAFRTIPSSLQPYQTDQTYQAGVLTKQPGSIQVTTTFQSSPGSHDAAMAQSGQQYGTDLYLEVHRYAAIAARIAMQEEFDVIHAHDWMTYPAGIAIAKMSGKPLAVHIHSTEFDRSGEHVNQMVYDIERAGLHCADRVIAVSGLTQKTVIDRYDVPAEKTCVVYNAIEQSEQTFVMDNSTIIKDERLVLFLGRITMQKGPEYFLAAAKKVLEVMDDVKFVMAGNGDMIQHAIELSAELGIGHKVLFTGFLCGDDVDKIFRMADVFVMPSVSEPFGLVPLEALRNDVPVIISKQSGVSEVLTHALKVDFWDIDEMANMIIAVLRHRPLQATLAEHGNFEVRGFAWANAAQECIDVYESLVAVGV